MKKIKNKINIVKILIMIIFILIAIVDILMIKRIKELEAGLNLTEIKCLKYYESAIEILK